MRPHDRASERGSDGVLAVRCLRCGFEYRKPKTGDMFLDNPGCPRCDYVGWTGWADFPLSRSGEVPEV
jgi:hypothetical protein